MWMSSTPPSTAAASFDRKGSTRGTRPSSSPRPRPPSRSAAAHRVARHQVARHQHVLLAARDEDALVPVRSTTVFEPPFALPPLPLPPLPLPPFPLPPPLPLPPGRPSPSRRCAAHALAGRLAAAALARRPPPRSASSSCIFCAVRGPPLGVDEAVLRDAEEAIDEDLCAQLIRICARRVFSTRTSGARRKPCRNPPAGRGRGSGPPTPRRSPRRPTAPPSTATSAASRCACRARSRR